jgi:hypothetical protein
MHGGYEEQFMPYDGEAAPSQPAVEPAQEEVGA